MDFLKYNKIKKIWLEASQHMESPKAPSDFELAVYKTLLARFHVGAYYYYVFNLDTLQMEFVSPEMASITGYDPDSFTVETILDNIHPDDLDRFIKNEEQGAQFFSQLSPEQILNHKICYDFRLRCTDGSYRWILQQINVIQTNDTGALIRSLCVHTDITHLKTEEKAIKLHIEKLSPAIGQLISTIKQANDLPDVIFTDREKEILQLILAGKKTSEIADMLCLSPHTINTHRKNILRKSGLSSFYEIARKGLV